ncbi:MAG: DNA methyltransferase [Candidatus Thermoplasmatota archaeon]|nr:DNA methyltransferase [Candidatus Thermoplasmatota archaeon]
MIETWSEIDWTFLNENTREFTHIYHDYPARMIPQIPRTIINLLNENEGNVLFDPYCGSGSTLVEGLLAGLNVIGTDINPLAKLISEAKTEYTIPPNDLIQEVENFVQFTFAPKGKPKIIRKDRLDFWFKPSVIKRIGLIIRYIDKIRDRRIKKFFEVTASETIRESSNTRKNEFKLYRYSPERLEKHNPDPFAIMKDKLFRNFKGYVSFYKAMSELAVHPSSQVYSFNSAKPIPQSKIKSNSVDIVITSPPYGDSHTTVAYGQYSRLSSEWLGILKQNIDATSMGGASIKSSYIFGCESLDDAIKEISASNLKRSLEVNSFYVDLEKSIRNVSTLIKTHGYACYVVANRRVAGVSLPTDQAVKYFFEQNGFSHFNTFIRNIPNKRMPSRNSPSNIAGKTEETMSREYIVVMKKN